MRALGQNSVLNRIRRRDVIEVKAAQARDAGTYLGQTNKVLVRLTSAGAGTFYVWVSHGLTIGNHTFYFQMFQILAFVIGK